VGGAGISRIVGEADMPRWSPLEWIRVWSGGLLTVSSR
jgi:hypothetical protein